MKIGRHITVVVKFGAAGQYARVSAYISIYFAQ
jgi:hypothetical protein